MFCALGAAGVGRLEAGGVAVTVFVSLNPCAVAVNLPDWGVAIVNLGWRDLGAARGLAGRLGNGLRCSGAA